jgi:hypothetical protein
MVNIFTCIRPRKETEGEKYITRILTIYKLHYSVAKLVEGEIGVHVLNQCLREVRKPYGSFVAKTRNVSYWESRRKFETVVKAIYTTLRVLKSDISH